MINANPTATDAILLSHRFIDASAKGKSKVKRNFEPLTLCGFFGRQETTDLQQGGQQKYN
jgi:hypothetical protein